MVLLREQSTSLRKSISQVTRRQSPECDRLRPPGCKTGLVGKWHLGYPDDYQPNRRGFDWFYDLLQGSRSYFPMAKSNPHRAFQENTTPTEEGGYTTESDIGEAKDASTSNPEQMKAMLERMKAWEAQLVEPLWGMKAEESVD